MADTIFKKIIDKSLKADIVFEDDRVIAFRDINPKAPVHILVVPKQEIERVLDATQADEALLGHLLTVAAELARKERIDTSGFRLVINNGHDAGESVPHLHLHLLGGRPMTWPPG